VRHRRHPGPWPPDQVQRSRAVPRALGYPGRMDGDKEARRPLLSRPWGPVGILLASGALATVFAIVVGFGLAFEGLLLGGLPMAFVGIAGGPVLGAMLGLGLGLSLSAVVTRRAQQYAEEPEPARLPAILRAFPEGRVGRLSAWALALLLLASPFPLLWAGGLPPVTLVGLGGTALLSALCFLQCARCESFWPAIVVPLWPMLTLFAMSQLYPCWQASNAAWCGHMCDSPPAHHCGPGDFGAPQDHRGEDP
jgi:hypothetical protein